MTFTDLGDMGQATATAAGATLAITTTQQANAGDLIVVICAWNNTNAGTNTGPWDPHIRCDDDSLNDYHTLASGQNVGTGTGLGAHVGVFAAVLDKDLPSGAKITLTHRSNAGLTAKAASARRFSCAKGNVMVPLNGNAVERANASDPNAISLASMRSDAYLLIHAIASEGPSTDAFTQDSDYTTIVAAGTNAGGAPDADMTVRGGFRIATLTGDTVDVAVANTRDYVQVLAAVRETDAPYVRWADGLMADLAALHTASASSPSVSFNGAINDAWTRKGDIALAIFGGQTTNKPGLGAWTVLDLGILGSGTLVIGDIIMQAYWKRLDGSETSIATEDIGSANTLSLVILGGCVKEGFPFENLGEATEVTADTSVEFTGNNPSDTSIEQLILMIAANGRDVTTATYSGWTNANLNDLQEIVDWSTNLVNGFGQGIGAGYMPAGGSVGAGTATIDSNDVDLTMTLAVRGKRQGPNGYPWMKNVLGQANGLGNVSPSWASGRVDPGDLIVLFVQNEGDGTPTAPTGYSELTNSPSSQATVGVSVFYKFADGTETGVTQTDTGDHTFVLAVSFGGVDQGTPINVSGKNTNASSTSVSVTGVTTTKDKCLVIYVCSHSVDTVNNLEQFSGWTDASLVGMPGTTKLQPVSEMSQNAGNGGGLGIAMGTLASAGASGTATATLANASVQACICFALNPFDFSPAEVSFE